MKTIVIFCLCLASLVCNAFAQKLQIPTIVNPVVSESDSTGSGGRTATLAILPSVSTSTELLMQGQIAGLMCAPASWVAGGGGSYWYDVPSTYPNAVAYTYIVDIIKPAGNGCPCITGSYTAVGYHVTTSAITDPGDCGGQPILTAPFLYSNGGYNFYDDHQFAYNCPLGTTAHNTPAGVRQLPGSYWSQVYTTTCH